MCRRVSHYLLENGGDGQMTPLLRLGSGACAGIIGMTATYPLDMIRGRLTVQAGKEYAGIMHATRSIIKQVRVYMLHVTCYMSCVVQLWSTEKHSPVTFYLCNVTNYM